MIATRLNSLNVHKMIFRIEWWPFLALIFSYLTAKSKAQLFFQAPAFDCSRIHPRYCCTTRVRLSCPQLCNQRPCSRTPTFVQPFSPHIPATLPFPGLAPQPQPQVPQQSRLPTLIDPTAITPNVVKHHQPQPSPPQGIVLPPIDVPLAVGTPLPGSGEQPPETLSKVDGFAPAVHGQGPSIPSTAVGAGGSFAPIGPTNPSPFQQTSTLSPPSLNTFPTLIPFVPASTVSTAMPPSVAPPWAFSSVVPETANSQFATTVQPIQQTRNSQGPPTVVDSHSHATQNKKKAVLPPPNRFITENGEELIELESIDRRAIHVDSRAAVDKVVRSKDTVPTIGIEDLESGIDKTLILRPNTFPSPINANISEQITESHEQIEPTARTTIPEKSVGPGGWSFKIMPSKLGKEAVLSKSHGESIPDFNNSHFTSQWIGSQTLGTTVGPTPATGSGIISKDKLGGVIDSIFTRQTIDRITSLTGKRPPSRSKGRTASATAPPPIASNLQLTNTTNQTGINFGSGNGQCGVAPNFAPCLDFDRANLRLLACCRSKLPEGCWPLCKYDTTQAEVKRAFDAGKCGILSVSPFLECASQGQDNRHCCNSRQITIKSGPQCEVFCHPRDGLGSLGLQHLTCQNVISDLLYCHHSGLRP